MDNVRRRLGFFDSLAGKRLARREAFKHRVVAIPKPYPDSQLILERRGISRRLQETGQFLQLNVYTADFYGLPDDLFTNREINWHNQQLGQKGLIAAAGLWIKDSTATISLLQSDLCQQLYRHAELRRSCKTRVENHFKHWYAILVNAILDFCLDGRISAVYCPTGLQIIRETQKQVIPDLFIRIYDYANATYLCRKVIRGTAEYWKISVSANSERIARLIADTEIAAGEEGTRICIFHDIEENIDTNISAVECANNLTNMLEIENATGIKATYNLLGLLFRFKQEEIHTSNPHHSIAFHSFNHNLDDMTQLEQCRKVDLRVRGYRPPKSRITSELSDYALTCFNFEWLASSATSLGHANCKLENGLVKIPIHTDDYALATKSVDYSGWEADLLDFARAHTFFAFGLHDCYAREWLRHYPRLLGELAKIGRFVTADQICDGTLRQALTGTFRQRSRHGQLGPDC